MGRIESSRRSLVAQIHILKKDVGMSDLEYITCLEEWTGKASCSDMSGSELEEVRRRMCLLPKAAAKDDCLPGCSPEQWRKIKWLQRKLRWNDQNLRGYIKRVTKMEHERFLDVPSARRVITGLVRVMEHEERKG